MLFGDFPSTDPFYPACWSCKSPAVFAVLVVEFSFTETPIAVVLNKIRLHCVYSCSAPSLESCLNYIMIFDVESSASLYSSAKSNLRDKVLGEVERTASLLCQAKGDSAMCHALKTMCPNMGKIVRRFIVIIQRGHDQSMDILPMGGWRGE